MLTAGVLLKGGEGHDEVLTVQVQAVLAGGSGDDTMTGNGADSRLSGGDGEDVLQGWGRLLGGEGADLLTGWEQGGVLIGGEGADTLVGRGGVDVLIGGDGADTFRFSGAGAPGGKLDRIVDLGAGDVIAFAPPPWLPDAPLHLVEHFSGQAGEVVVTYDAAADATYVDIDFRGWGFAEWQIAHRRRPRRLHQLRVLTAPA